MPEAHIPLSDIRIPCDMMGIACWTMLSVVVAVVGSTREKGGLTLYGLPLCPPVICEPCAEEGATDVPAILAIDCSQDLSECHPDLPACHEPLKDCVKCHPFYNREACTKECHIGPGPCIHDAKVAAGKCVVAKKEAHAKCVVDKRVALAKAHECLACHCPDT